MQNIQSHGAQKTLQYPFPLDTFTLVKATSNNITHISSTEVLQHCFFSPFLLSFRNRSSISFLSNIYIYKTESEQILGSGHLQTPYITATERYKQISVWSSTVSEPPKPLSAV